MTATDPATATTARPARPARRMGDAPGVHPATAALFNAIQRLARYQPTSPADAAAVLRSIGGDDTGHNNLIAETIEALRTIAGSAALTSQVTAAAAEYAQDATDHIAERWQGTGGQIANGEVVRIVTANPATPVPDFHQQFRLYEDDLDDPDLYTD